MIQRIQTIYLFLIAGLMLAMLFMPLASVGLEEGDVLLVQIIGGVGEKFASAWKWIFVFMCGLSALLALVAIFSYKNRKKQVKFCWANLFFILLPYGALFFLFNVFPGEIQSVSMNVALCFPLIAIILNLLAIAAIKKDERLVRSADRLR